MVAVKDLAGLRFGRLTVLRRKGSERGAATWLCRCDCGAKTIVTGVRLRLGRTRSCGCFARQVGLAWALQALAAIMHDVAHFCRSVERACVGDPTCWIGLRQLAVRRVWVDLPRWRLIGAHGPAPHGPDRMRPRATVRNNVPSGFQKPR